MKEYTRTYKSLKSHITEKLQKAFQPEVLSIKNESFRHKAPEDSETHFKVLIVSKYFAQQTPIERHKAVMSLLSEEMKGPIHALSLQLMTISEYKESYVELNTPNCHKKELV